MPLQYQNMNKTNTIELYQSDQRNNDTLHIRSINQGSETYLISIRTIYDPTNPDDQRLGVKNAVNSHSGINLQHGYQLETHGKIIINKKTTKQPGE